MAEAADRETRWIVDPALQSVGDRIGDEWGAAGDLSGEDDHLRIEECCEAGGGHDPIGDKLLDGLQLPGPVRREDLGKPELAIDIAPVGLLQRSDHLLRDARPKTERLLVAEIPES